MTNTTDFNFYDIFKEIKFEISERGKQSTSKWLQPINQDYNILEYRMAAIQFKHSDLGFVFYIADECPSVWGCCNSLHDNSPFHGQTMFDEYRVFKRTIDVKNNFEVIQLEYSYIGLRNVYIVKHDSPLKFRNESEFEDLIKRFNDEMFNCCEHSTTTPSCNNITIDEQGYYTPTVY